MTDPGAFARKQQELQEQVRRAEEAARQYQITMDGIAEKNARDAIAANRRIESDYSRGSSGGCSQDENNRR